MNARRAACAVALLAVATGLRAVPTFADVRAAHRPSDVTLLDRQGVPIQTLRVDPRVRRLDWVPLADMSAALLEAIVLSEDRHFYEHSGVDWSAVATSAWGNLWNRKTRGASTLTMQLAGLIDAGLVRPPAGRSLPQKVGQVLAAQQLDAQWRKSDILEAYLNSVPFRGEIVGIDALSLTLFGKHPSGLDAQEAALTAALLRGPNADAATVTRRACGVLTLQRLDCAGLPGLAATALVRQGGMPLSEQLAPHFARLVIDPAGAPRQRSSLDAGLQRVAIAALHRQLAELSGRQVEDGAVVVLDNASGQVLAWVGSSGDLSGAAQVDGVLARRQPGSTLKPWVYELALERRLITPASLIDDAPAQFETQNGLYLPQDYDHDFKGWVSARTALGASLNVPAVRVGAMLGMHALVERFNALGLALQQPAGYYGNSLVLGSADVTLLALTNAYRALANGGDYSPVALRTANGPPVHVADRSAVFLVTDMLADNNARAMTFGMDSVLKTRGFAAVKTGTSKDMRDNWCIGYTDRYTVGVWVGNSSGEPMHGVSGVSGAAPVWHALITQLHETRRSNPPSAPGGVVRAAIRFEDGLEPPRDEVFVAGTQQSVQRAGRQVRGATSMGIASPRDGSIYALDPDMPPRAQRIIFEGEPGTWVLDGRRLGTGARLAWFPWPGRHVLALAPRTGGATQTIRFEVRGAAVKTAQSGAQRH